MRNIFIHEQVSPSEQMVFGHAGENVQGLL